MGLVAPVTIKYRIDLQELWSTGYSWNDILPEAIQQEMEGKRRSNKPASYLQVYLTGGLNQNKQ